MKRDDPGAALAPRGLRVTRQRAMRLDRLRHSRSDPTAIEPHRQILAKLTSTRRKTVYEALRSLVSSSLASRVTEGE